jgi:hypothetical protein
VSWPASSGRSPTNPTDPTHVPFRGGGGGRRRVMRDPRSGYETSCVNPLCWCGVLAWCG